MEKTIYDLELHEKLQIGNTGTVVTRVPGGWIYTTHISCVLVNTIFVPYNIEFKKCEGEIFNISTLYGHSK